MRQFPGGLPRASTTAAFGDVLIREVMTHKDKLAALPVGRACDMTLYCRLDLDGATFGGLYRFVDHARSAGVPADQPLTVEAHDALGNQLDTHTLVAELGEVDELSRPVMIDPSNARRYLDALHQLLTQQSDREDGKIVGELADLLAGITRSE
jgi:hypothetical protein